ncbi:MAG: hypothetical protein KF708_11785 [Pirellulales bacterium]|nr:hypothetical protein [Pirellulales bacterium]
MIEPQGHLRCTGRRAWWSLRTVGVALLSMMGSAMAQQPIVAPAPPVPPSSFPISSALGSGMNAGLATSQVGLSSPTGTETVLSSEPITREEAMLIGRSNVIDPGGPDFWNPDLEKSRAMAELWPFVTWYLKAGTVTPVGGGFLEDHIRTGFTIQTGGRAPISDPDAPLVWFGEIGGTYMGNDGTGSGVIRPGALVITPPSVNLIPQPPIIELEPNFYNTYLASMRRGSIQVGTGLQFTPQFAANQGWRKLQFNGRGGLRLGHARMKYLDTYTPELLADIVAAEALVPGASISLRPSNVFELGDTFFGLYTSLGFAITWEDVCWGPCYFSTVSLAGDLEYSNEWIDTGAFSPTDNSLGTLVPTISLNLCW